MKKEFALLISWVSRINRHHVKLLFTLFAVIMLVLGVGAPEDGGGAGN